MRHLSSENVCCIKHEHVVVVVVVVVVVNFGDFGVVKKWLPPMVLARFLFFDKKTQNFIKMEKMEMWLKPLVGAKFVANKVTTTKDPILA